MSSLRVPRRGHRSANRVLLVGAPRCGSTWLANVLARAPETKTVYEPDGPVSDVLGAMIASRHGHYPVLRPGQADRWYRTAWDLAFAGGWPWDQVEGARAAGRSLLAVPPAVRDAGIATLARGVALVASPPANVVVKSVNCELSLDWIDQRYHPTTLLLRRNPLNIVSSWLATDIDDWPVARAGAPDPGIAELAGLTPPGADASPTATAAWDVGVLHLALRRAADAHPEWIEASYDELSTDPQTHCRELLPRLGLEFSPEVAAFIDEADTPGFVVHQGTPSTHPNARAATDGTSRRLNQATLYRRRLSDAQIAEARAILDRFDLGRWGPDPVEP